MLNVTIALLSYGKVDTLRHGNPTFLLVTFCTSPLALLLLLDKIRLPMLPSRYITCYIAYMANVRPPLTNNVGINNHFRDLATFLSVKINLYTLNLSA